jgi:hypothetical protein
MNRRPHPIPLACAIALGALAPLALAQSQPQPPTSDPAQSLPKVTVQGQRDDYRAPETETGNRVATVENH